MRTWRKFERDLLITSKISHSQVPIALNGRITSDSEGIVSVRHSLSYFFVSRINRVSKMDDRSGVYYVEQSRRRRAQQECEFLLFSRRRNFEKAHLQSVTVCSSLRCALSE